MILTIWHSRKEKLWKEQRVVVKRGGWGGEEEQIGGTQEIFRTVKLLCKMINDKVVNTYHYQPAKIQELGKLEIN